MICYSKSPCFGNARQNQDEDGLRVANQAQEVERSGEDVGYEYRNDWWWPAVDYVRQLDRSARWLLEAVFSVWFATGALEQAARWYLPDDSTVERITLRVEFLLDWYIYGESRGEEQFMNKVMDYFVRNERRMLELHISSLVCRPIIEKVYKYTPSDSPLRKFLVDLTVVTMPQDMAALIPRQEPCIEYLRDTVQAYQRAIDSGGRVETPFQKHPCEYHTHSNGLVGDMCTSA